MSSDSRCVYCCVKVVLGVAIKNYNIIIVIFPMLN